MQNPAPAGVFLRGSKTEVLSPDSRVKLFALALRVHYRRGKKMEDNNYQIEGADIGLLIFVVVAAWLLVFQSGLF